MAHNGRGRDWMKYVTDRLERSLRSLAVIVHTDTHRHTHTHI